MLVYISGPITGRPEEEWRAEFKAASDKLRAMGHAPVNPADIGDALAEDCLSKTPGKTLEWEDYMREDIKALTECGGICMLPGWMRSRGAFLEYLVALHLGLKAIDIAEAA